MILDANQFRICKNLPRQCFFSSYNISTNLSQLMFVTLSNQNKITKIDYLLSTVLNSPIFSVIHLHTF